MVRGAAHIVAANPKFNLRIPACLPHMYRNLRILRRAERSSHFNLLGYTLSHQGPAKSSVLEPKISIISFRGINSSASQPNENELVCTPRPPLKHNMQKRPNFRLGDARGNMFQTKKSRPSTPAHYTALVLGFWRKSRRSQHVAVRIAASFRNTCTEVVAKDGGMARG